ncbi:MAG: ABC transporter permease [Curvibacter sp.]|nr:ABC transporter permease [Curvibacter sp.]
MDTIDPRSDPKSGGRLLPLTATVLVIVLLWYALTVWLNGPGAIERVLAPKGPWSWQDLVLSSWTLQRPVLPAPHQIAADFWSSLVDWPIDSPRNLLFHVAVTGQSTLLGFAMGTALGAVLAVLIVHSRTLDRALLPWVVASQTIPVLAIAPIVLVILGSLGFSGVLPKAVIAMYLCFFPVAVAAVQGLRSPQRIETELMHTYAASAWQTLWLLRLPAAWPFIFPALRVGVAAGLVGAMVAELPTGAQAGLGSRLLTGSYYGNTVQIWSALLMASLLGLLLSSAMAALEKWALRHRSRT